MFPRITLSRFPTSALLATVLAAVLMVLLIGAAVPVAAGAEGETFLYDFTNGFGPENHEQNNQILIEPKDGYVTFTSDGEDPYFRFVDGREPPNPTHELAYAVIKYRTSAPIAQGELFSNRRSGPQWGADGTHVTWKYRADGEWHADVFDTLSAWGGATDDHLYAFRFDPLASGCRKGDSIDVAYIRFFSNRDAAETFAVSEDPSLVPTTEVPTYTIRFLVNGNVVATVTYTDQDTKIEEPVVPEIPGQVGYWEPYTLNGQDLTVHAVYEPTSVEIPPVMPDPETVPETEDRTAAQTAVPETHGATDTDPSAGTDTGKVGEETSGCTSLLSLSSLSFLTVSVVLIALTGRASKRKERS